ncbi:MAG: hypothetical protein PHC68_14930 [Syntrophorhabdaceae bacterium]|jgi:hypothetical protein|nr:hypothetical protein [Syntrophorhabdaceae bacterium]
MWENPFPNLPTFTESFPDSNIVAPVLDTVVGGIEAGVSIATGAAAGAGLLVGPEGWIVTGTMGPVSLSTGADAYNRISGAIDRLQQEETECH